MSTVLYRLAGIGLASALVMPANAQLLARKDLSAAIALTIMIGEEVIGAAGVAGAPGGDKDEACVKAGLDKVADQLK